MNKRFWMTLSYQDLREVDRVTRGKSASYEKGVKSLVSHVFSLFAYAQSDMFKSWIIKLLDRSSPEIMFLCL